MGADEAGVSPHTQYILTNFLLFFSAALVMWMAAGFCMLESGLVRAKSTAIVCLKNLMLYAIACLAYFVVGYNLMYADLGIFVFPEGFELGFLADANNSEHLAAVLSKDMFSLTDVVFSNGVCSHDCLHYFRIASRTGEVVVVPNFCLYPLCPNLPCYR